MLRRILESLAIVLVATSIAWALEGGQNISISNGEVALSGTIPVANGGTNLTGATDDVIMVGNGTTWESKAVPSCSGNNALQYNTGTNTISCGAIGGGSSITPEISWTTSSDVVIDSGGTATVYVSVNGDVSATENNVTSVSQGGSFTNLRCFSQDGASNVTVEMGDGACTGALTYAGTLSVTPTTALTPTAADTDTESVTAGHCVAFRISISSGTTTGRFSCSYEKSAD